MKDKKQNVFNTFLNINAEREDIEHPCNCIDEEKSITDIKQKGLNNATTQIEERLERKTALRVLQDLSKRMYPNLDLFGHPTLVIDRPEFEEVRKKYLDELSKDNVVLSREELHKRDEDAYQVGITMGKKFGSKETAEKIIKKIKRTAVPVAVGKYSNMKFIETSEEELNAIAKQYGVEIKEKEND